MLHSTEAILRAEGELGWLDGRAIVVHNHHLAIGEKRASKCGFCTKGMATVIKVYEAEVPITVVRDSTGTDEKQATTLPSDDGESAWGY